MSGYQTTALTGAAASLNPLVYQWYANGQPVPAATSNVLPGALARQYPGPYQFTVSDGSTNLHSKSVQVAYGPLFSSSPQNAIVYSGDPARFDVSIIGPGPFAFQWYHNRAILPGATAQSLSLSNVTTVDAGSYSVEVSNVNAVARSNPAELVVLSPNSQLVSFDDFEASANAGWSLPATTVTAVGQRRLLGEFKNDSVRLSLSGLPPHDELEVSFDLIIRGYWQGNSRPDTWRLTADGVFLINTTFSTFTSQAFPGSYGNGINNPPCAGAMETNTLGYGLSFVDDKMIEDARFRISGTITHTNASALLSFSASIGNPTEAGWSLDNVAVVAKSQYGSRLQLSAVAGDASLSLKVSGAPGSRVRVDSSTDLQNWSSLGQVLLSSGSTNFPVIIDTKAPLFFRAAAGPGL